MRRVRPTVPARMVGMERIHLTAASVLLVLSGCTSKPSGPPLATVSSVDLKRYSGRWYEVARLPNRFQRDDSRATAMYTREADGRIGVLNTETRPDGTQREVRGHASPVPGNNNAKLAVSFEGLAALAPVPDDGNYWILALAPDYSVSLVGTQDRKFLWLLSRHAPLNPKVRSRYLDKAKSLGFPVDRVLIADWPDRHS